VREIVLHAEAKVDLIRAIAYYDGQRDGLGDEFLTAVERAAEQVAENPSWFPLSTDQGHRKCVLKKFPYSLHFVSSEDVVTVMAVAHHRRDPNYWRHREPG
jgi:toxin ParE1/3/4